jgi:hypothetical protein
MIRLPVQLEWLIERREEANYRLSRFIEPGVPQHFRRIVSDGVRRSLSAYVSDDTFLYAFDESHAILAFPLEVLKATLVQLSKPTTGYYPSAHDLAYLASIYVDEHGPLPDIRRLLTGT